MWWKMINRRVAILETGECTPSGLEKFSYIANILSVYTCEQSVSYRYRPKLCSTAHENAPKYSISMENSKYFPTGFLSLHTPLNAFHCPRNKILATGLVTFEPSDYVIVFVTFRAVRQIKNKKLSYRRDSARCVKRPFKVIGGHPLVCQSTAVAYMTSY